VLVVDPIKLFFENGLRYDSAETPYEVFQDCAFPAWQDQRAAADHHISFDRVKADVAGLQDGSKRPTWAAQQCLRARYELCHRKWLDEVVVGTGIETADAILDRIACGQHQHGRLIAAGPQFSEQVEPVAIG